MKYISCRSGGEHIIMLTNHTKKVYTNKLFNLGFVEVISTPNKGITRSLSLGKY